MEEPTTDERKRWWLLCYGITSMEKAIRSCDLIAKHCADDSDPLFQPLSLAVHAYYARPFKPSRGAGRLPADLVPAAATGIHSWLEHFRDGVMSHVDANISQTAGRPMNDVVYSIAGSKRQFSTLDARTPLHAYSDVKQHCEAMIAVFQSEMFELIKRFHELLPQNDGEYLLSLEDGSPLFVAGHVTPISSRLDYQ
jgi:hypothetical protein